MKTTTHPFQILLILIGCGFICFGVISAVILIPALFAQFGLAILGPFAGYLALAVGGIVLMLLAKRLPLS